MTKNGSKPQKALAILENPACRCDIDRMFSAANANQLRLYVENGWIDAIKGQVAFANMLGATIIEMNKEQVLKSINAGKLFQEDFPTDTFHGVVTVLVLFLVSAGLMSAVIFDILHNKPPEPAMIAVGIGSGVGFVVQLLAFLHEDKLTSVKTGLSVEHNHMLVARCMQELDWVLIQNNKYALVAYTSVWLRFIEQHIVVLVHDDCVYINAKHLGNTRGRFPSLFGLNQRRIKQLIEKIESAAPNISYHQPPASSSA